MFQYVCKGKYQLKRKKCIKVSKIFLAHYSGLKPPSPLGNIWNARDKVDLVQISRLTNISTNKYSTSLRKKCNWSATK